MLFFQTTLLGGYVYSFCITKWLSLRAQIALHVVVASIPLFTLPFAIPSNWNPASSVDPAWSLSMLLILMAAIPMFVVSASAPLFQRWFAETSHHSAHDPYYLYAVSNAGSMLALLSYPFVVEPAIGLTQQSQTWSALYLLFFLLIILCAVQAWKMQRTNAESATKIKRESSPAEPTTTDRNRRFLWVALAFLPSSWMLSVTTRLTTDIAPMPLLWIVPLAIYLLTFILVFARQKLLPHSLVTKIFPFAVLLLAASLVVTIRWVLISLNLFVFFIAAMYCHGELAKRRPAVEHLPQFYLWMSVGGALGGLFNALIAPHLFSVLLEFPIVVALSCLLHPGRIREGNERFDLAGIAMTALGMVLLIRNLNISLNLSVVVLVTAGTPVLLLLYYSRRQMAFVTLLAVVMIWAELHSSAGGELLHTERSFYGIHRVVIDNENADTRFRYLLHGTTLHGFQNTSATGDQLAPLGYYHRAGPLGDVMTAYPSGKQEIAVIGLGVGATASYASKDRVFTFYEVDRVVARIAETPEYFSYLSDSGAQYEIVLGDGRQMISAEQDERFHIIMLDAFSSDAVPTHLLTRQALAIYRSKLAKNGVLVFHLSNNYLDLKVVLADLAQDAGLAAYVKEDFPSDEEQQTGKSPSTYVILASSKQDLLPVLAFPNWKALKGRVDANPWTDDYSNIFDVLKWNASN